jgi:hypothetical protein
MQQFLKFITYHIIYYPSVGPYRITKSVDMEIVTFLGLKRWDQHQVYNKHMVQYSFLKFDVYIQLNVFQASPRPSSGAQHCSSSLWFFTVEAWW